MKTIRLRPGKERSLLRRHPWIFESAIAKGGGDGGETVRVESADGRFLAWAAFSPASRIRARAWSFDEAQRIDPAFFAAAVERAVRARERFAIESDGVRLVHGESDGLPGLVVDRYGDTLVAQFTSAGTERWKAVLADALLKATGLQKLYERSDASVRQLEGLEPATGWLRGEGPTELSIREHGWRLTLDIAEGHKTGFYLDQRDSRHRFSEAVRRLGARQVLNCYCYTGGFTVAALAGGASQVTSIDSSGPALERARSHAALNGFDAARTEFLDADVNASLRRFLQEGRRFDAIVLDPPKFAPTAAHAERAARAYKDINRLGLQLLSPGGLLYTFSCSGGISADLFHKIVASAGADAGVDGYILERLGGAPDHPMTLEFPEGEYLKGLAVMRKAA
ncbi:class I SAM-dependent methyltransferase [Paracidovorax citrulli]|uniref:23S rRNA m(5)C-1962 methyltransferase / SAM-dependent methyltransferase n=2 Tax=Paracidovorax citrulli TaxID=80869 RepID=A1TKB5_PARC0|nr:class I SAM-dependent methyltransferase [Paracidovorax citrulli]ABM31403.1 23S rRNA m(5)C-1962 methyltransferase / SAM-dependent methyltransferase [Paracidovorax citrulli AAC00-1]ATG95484.1 23S rRNA (cytosine(1962)-C(5))-methyltransferase RlmI [Paracidovorax citrulli]PVY65590.1 23S rRNA m(5)C-1962 methyltransferase [Paracidovorax citrulli]QCX11325.1 Ribosomal RNA large subunit methyltransferase I [Paracidovorax citrulli]REG70237.1 23S rRNA m(5)C-1962 methyltransferase [Paracidovorax citrull